MKFLFRGVPVLLIVLCAVLAVTNPAEPAHKTAYHQAVSGQAGMGGVWRDIATNVLGRADVLPLSYNNYLLFSQMKLRGDTVTIGLCNHVWVVAGQ